MHDIGRTQAEQESVFHELQPEHFEYEGESELFGETMGESPLHEAFEVPFHEAALHEVPLHEAGMHEMPLHESEELELATELLEVSNEAELDRFLGGLIRRVGRAVGSVVRSPIGGMLGGVLKRVARTALPLAGRALGAFVGGPVGSALGGQLATTAGQMFGLELEGLSGEDRELEVARRYVRFASAAARNSALAPPTAPPQAAVRSAVAAAARRFAPGLLRRGACACPSVGGFPRAPEPGIGIAPSDGVAPAGSRRRGMWIRRGRRIILFGV